MPGDSSIQSIQRAIRILYAVAGVEEGCTIARIAERTGIKPNTVYKITRTLEREHLLVRKENPLRFMPGSAISELKALDDQRSLLTAAAQILIRTQARLPQSSFVLLERSGSDVYQRLCVQYNRPGVVIRQREFLVPLYTKASSLLFLAYSRPEEEQRIYDNHPFEKYGRGIWKTRARLDLFLAQTRQLGYCIPPVPDVDGSFYRLAAPVFLPGNEMVAAVGGILKEEDAPKFNSLLVRLCCQAAREITEWLQQEADKHLRDTQAM